MISEDKQRIYITLTKEQIAQLDRTSKEMGLTRSNLIAVATMQYINTFEISKDITKSALSDAISKAIKEGELDIEKLKKL